MAIPCVILCGGKSSRMGTNKALLPLHGTPLISYQYHRLASLFPQVYISAKAPLFDLPFICEDSALFSPLVGIKASFEALQSPRIFFICVDTPFITESSIKKLLDSAPPSSLVHFAKSHAKSHYLTSLWHRDALPLIKHAIESQDYKLAHLITPLLHTHRASFLEYNNPQEFLNLNTPQDYQTALREAPKDKPHG